ncbi:hypothetical protein CL648_00730 [bacterium]|nr:hypothetical protein [bacterium]
MSPATQKQAQSETNLQEFKTKLNDLKLNDLISPNKFNSPNNFNKNKMVTNNEYLVNELSDIYFRHCNTDNKPLNEQLSTLIDNWIHDNSIQSTRIGTGEAITHLLQKKYTEKQNDKSQWEAKKATAKATAATQATAKATAAPQATAAPPKLPTPKKPAPTKPAAQRTLKLSDMHDLLEAIYRSEVSKSQKELNEESFVDCDTFLKADCEALKNKSGQLLPKPVLDAILTYCCFNNNGLKPDALISVLKHLHTKFNDITSTDNKLSMYQHELIRVLKEIHNISTPQKPKKGEQKETKSTNSVEAAILIFYSLLPENGGMDVTLTVLLDYLGKQKLPTNMDTAKRIHSQT